MIDYVGIRVRSVKVSSTSNIDKSRLDEILGKLDKYPKRLLENVEELVHYGKMFD